MQNALNFVTGHTLFDCNGPSTFPAIVGMSEAQWYFTWDEFQSNTMSDLEERRAAAQFIARVGKALDLVQVVIATAQVFMHRFYARESFKKFNYHVLFMGIARRST